ncbi:MAG: DUF2130 domain-containing protein [Syntrophales bacterium]|jgi:hypothetical protein|nr:DUF2130 domain-containing protein [Syntrophales bacterium]MDY0045283.1 DUF2130 domain-containing protein [Syntrophales bacterium]
MRMPENVIICPNCRREIPLTEAISHRIREELKKEQEEETRKKEFELQERISALKEKEERLVRERKSFDSTITERLKVEQERIEKETKLRMSKAVEAELKDLRTQIDEKNRRLDEAQELELALRKERRELEEAKRAFELEMARKLDEERRRIRDAAVAEMQEAQRLKDLDKDKLIGDLKKQIEEMRRKAEQGSQQMQGEVLELELEDILRGHFPCDEIEPVPKGIRGADVFQKVHNGAGHLCGAILWESKRTKAWSDGWIDKLKDDQREMRADIAVLFTVALPKEVPHFAYIDGIWVTDYISVVGLVTALRMSLIQVALTKRASVGKNEKMEVLYNYLSGPEFRQKIEAIVETFISMKGDLDQEKRAMTRIWAKREKQIERVVQNTIGMYGDMQGIIGASLPQIESLTLDAPDACKDNEPEG